MESQYIHFIQSENAVANKMLWSRVLFESRYCYYTKISPVTTRGWRLLSPLVSRFPIDSASSIYSNTLFLHAPSTVVCSTTSSAPASTTIDGIGDTLVIYYRSRFISGWMLLRASASDSVQLFTMEEYQFCDGIVSETRGAPFTIPENRESCGSEPRKGLIWFTAESSSERVS